MQRRNRGGSIWEEYGRNIFVECSSIIATKAIGNMLHINKDPDSLFFQRSPDSQETCALAAMVELLKACLRVLEGGVGLSEHNGASVQ